MNPSYFKSSLHLQDYLAGAKKLQPFYNTPLRPDWKDLSGKVVQGFKQKAIVEELIAQNQTAKSEAAKNNCQLLKDEKTLVVITGQQLGLMLSPLYIIYKTLSTIWLAERLNKLNNGFNYVPVFWLEGEDHDYEEVKSLTFPLMSGGLHTLSLPENAAEQGMSMNKRVLDTEIETLLKELKDMLQPTDFQEDLFARLKDFYKPGTNWLQAFRAHMVSLFDDSGLLFFNAGSDTIKQLSIPFFSEMLQNNKQIVDSFASQSQKLEQAGYVNQVNIQDGKAYLFLTKSGLRQSLFLENNTFHVKETGETYTQDDLQEMLKESPQWISSTVLSRPLWQSYLLPVVSYVAGGAEIAYWAQLASGFEAMNIVMPHLQPRHSVTLLEPKTDRLLNKYDLDINAIPDKKETLIKDFFASTHLGQVSDTLSEFVEQVEQNRDKVKDLIKQVDPTLQSPAEKSYASILSTVNKLQDRLSHAISQKEGTIRSHLANIHENVLPDGSLQERVLTGVYFENKYGPDWIKKVLQQYNENFMDHLIVRL